MEYPTDIAINSVGKIVIIEYNRGVVVLDREGRRLKQSDHKHFNTLCGVAVDKDDNIYLIDDEVNNIYKSDKSMNDVTIKEIDQEDPGLLSVDVVGDEIMVIEDGNNHIKIYNTELEYVKHSKHSGPFINLTHDDHGNLYVIDGNSCIHVFSKDGEFLYSFGCDENGVNMLCEPWGVCVSGQYVYVADYGNHNVSVYTIEGEYVTSFG